MLGLKFFRVPLTFTEGPLVNVFKDYDARSLRKTLDKQRYRRLSTQVNQNYRDSLDEPLGRFLYALKRRGDPFYRRFLNKYGDGIYCGFSINDPSHLHERGLYAYFVGGDLKYVGKTIDSFQKRINQGYGTIHPGNCYLDGQVANCRVNLRIAENRERVSLLICPLEDEREISRLEEMLILSLDPEWNLQGRSMKSRVEIWLAAALLHEEGDSDFTAVKLEAKVLDEFEDDGPGVRTHIESHANASVPKNAGAVYNYLFRVHGSRLRLCRRNDSVHSTRLDRPISPSVEEIPAPFLELYSKWAEWQNR